MPIRTRLFLVVFHDLRHEAGSRWLEAGMPLHHVKELLGHANISTTDTYLNAGRVHLHESMPRALSSDSTSARYTSVSRIRVSLNCIAFAAAEVFWTGYWSVSK